MFNMTKYENEGVGNINKNRIAVPNASLIYQFNHFFIN